MFEQVIVGVDGRPAGRDAIALARLLVAPDGLLTLAHVYAGGGFVRPEAAAGDVSAAGREHAQRLLAQERDATAVDGNLVALSAPSVGSGLHHLAERSRADALVVGSCSRGFVGRVLVGNDTRASLNGSPCAVGVAPLGYAHDLRGLASVGVGYDGSPESEAALELARRVAERHGAAVRVLQVAQIPASPWATLSGGAWGAALAELEAEARTLLAGLDNVDAEVVLGIAGEELAAFGERVDLLVVGSRGYGPMRRLMFGSTSNHLAGHARCPLLVLPRVAGDAGTGGGATPS